MVWGSNPGMGVVCHPDQTCGPPGLLYNRYQMFPRVKAVEAWYWPTSFWCHVANGLDLYLCLPSKPP